MYSELSLKHTKTKRILYLEILRILACFSVIMVHTSAQNWLTVAPTSWDWRAMLIYNKLVRWPVFMFVMFSSILLLDPDKEISIRKVYQKIFRLLIAFLFWSAVYALFRFARGSRWQDAIKAFILGNFHMYYISIAIALYMVIPIFRHIASEKKILEYYLIVNFFWVFLIPTLISFLGAVDNSYIAFLVYRLSTWYNESQFCFAGVYSFYFAFGLYLYKYVSSRSTYRSVVIGAIIGYIIQVVLCIQNANQMNSVNDPFDFSVFNLTTASAVFLFGKNTIAKWEPSPRIYFCVDRISKATFGIYMIHMLVMDILQMLGFHTLTFPPIISIPALTIVIMAICYGIIRLLDQIPIIRKYVL